MRLEGQHGQAGRDLVVEHMSCWRVAAVLALLKGTAQFMMA